MTPLDLMLTAARELYAKGELAAAGMLAARAAPFVHAKFAATEAPAKLHREQVIQDDLFNFPQPTAPLGKKAAADAQAAAIISDGESEWSGLLQPSKPN